MQLTWLPASVPEEARTDGGGGGNVCLVVGGWWLVVARTKRERRGREQNTFENNRFDGEMLTPSVQIMINDMECACTTLTKTTSALVISAHPQSQHAPTADTLAGPYDWGNFFVVFLIETLLSHFDDMSNCETSLA